MNFSGTHEDSRYQTVEKIYKQKKQRAVDGLKPATHVIMGVLSYLDICSLAMVETGQLKPVKLKEFLGMTILVSGLDRSVTLATIPEEISS